MNIATTTLSIMQDWDKLIAEAPDEPQAVPFAQPAGRDIEFTTGIPKRYRESWERPTDAEWIGHFRKVMDKVEIGGIIALIGNRGTGKTRIAAEAVRNFSPDKATYTTAMGLFLRIRASFGKKGGETEEQIVKEMSQCALLVIDEVQERGNTAWEDRLLTHILDKRYGAMTPTIIIANLDANGLTECLGASIVSRINETGGIVTITGKSHRDA